MSEPGYPDYLRMIAPKVCYVCTGSLGHTDECRLNKNILFGLVIDPPFKGGMEGWGHIGNHIISYAIVECWKRNEFVQPSAPDQTQFWVLTERGQRCADHQLKAGEIWMPVYGSDTVHHDNAAVRADSTSVPGHLFTRDGTCVLCSKKMSAFGQISHAKSHIGKGDPVYIEEVMGKKFPRIDQTRSAELPPPPPTRAEAVVGPATFSGIELFSSADASGRSQCRLCPAGPPVHKFGHISHAKSHIARKDPVEIRFISKKNVPVVTGEIVLDSVAGPRIEPLPATAFVDPEREQGIAALLKIQECAGLEGTREEAEVNWDKMGPVSKMRTIRTAKGMEI